MGSARPGSSVPLWRPAREPSVCLSTLAHRLDRRLDTRAPRATRRRDFRRHPSVQPRALSSRRAGERSRSDASRRGRRGRGRRIDGRDAGHSRVVRARSVDRARSAQPRSARLAQPSHLGEPGPLDRDPELGRPVRSREAGARTGSSAFRKGRPPARPGKHDRWRGPFPPLRSSHRALVRGGPGSAGLHPPPRSAGDFSRHLRGPWERSPRAQRRGDHLQLLSPPGTLAAAPGVPGVSLRSRPGLPPSGPRAVSPARCLRGCDRRCPLSGPREEHGHGERAAGAGGARPADPAAVAPLAGGC